MHADSFAEVQFLLITITYISTGTFGRIMKDIDLMYNGTLYLHLGGCNYQMSYQRQHNVRTVKATGHKDIHNLLVTQLS